MTPLRPPASRSRRAASPWARATGRAVAAGVALLAAAGLAAQTAQFADRETVVAVEIPVHVTVDGRPVSGLRAEDFEVREGRRRQTIVGFDVFDLAVARDAPETMRAVDPTVPAAARRYFVLLFDLTQSEPRAVVRARSAAQRWVDQSLAPSDLVAVATWSHTRGARLHQTFTADRELVAAVLDHLALPAAQERRDPLGLLLADIERSAPGGAPPRRRAVGPEAGGDDALLAALVRLAEIERAMRRDERAAEAVAFSRSLGSLARTLAAVSGRKQVVLLSQGFDSALLHGAFDAVADPQAADAAVSGEIWRIDPRLGHGEARLGAELARAIAELRRADCAVQSIDIGGLLAEPAREAAGSDGRGTLLTLARETGGELYANFNNLGEAMDRLLEATRVTYVLTIEPRGLEPNGEFRPLDVRLATAPAGTRVRHRPGYFAPRPDALLAEVDDRIESAQLLLAGVPGGDLAAGLVAPILRLADGSAHVPVIVEADGRTVLAEAGRQPSVPVAVYAYAFDSAGRVVDFAAQTAELDIAQLQARLRREPLKLVGDLRLPPGRYSLRTLLRVGARGRYFLAHRELEIEPLAADALHVVSPLAVEPLERGVIVRLTAGRDERLELPFPFARRGEYFLPSGSPRLAAGRPLDLLLVVYGLGPGSAEIRGELVGADGRAVSDVAIFVVGDEVAGAEGLRRFSLAVTAAGARPGEYALRIGVRQGERTASAETAVTVAR